MCVVELKGPELLNCFVDGTGRDVAVLLVHSLKDLIEVFQANIVSISNSRQRIQLVLYDDVGISEIVSLLATYVTRNSKACTPDE